MVRPGQTIALRGGTYRPTQPITIETDGTASARITLTNYGSEHPVIDASTSAAGPFIKHHGAYWTVQGLEIRNARGNTYVCEGCRGEIFRRLTIRDGAATGFVLRDDGTVGNQVLDSDFSGHQDAAGAADGLAVIYGSGGGNLIRGCRFWGNAGDGMQTSVFGSPVTVAGSWAWGNAGNGFSLGSDDGMPVGHVVRDTAAWDNTGYGYTEAGNTGAIAVGTSTAFRNGKDGFAFFDSPSSFTRNLALGNAREARLNDSVSESGNSWNGTGWDVSKLASTDPSERAGAAGRGRDPAPHGLPGRVRPRRPDDRILSLVAPRGYPGGPADVYKGRPCPGRPFHRLEEDCTGCLSSHPVSEAEVPGPRSAVAEAPCWPRSRWSARACPAPRCCRPRRPPRRSPSATP